MTLTSFPRGRPEPEISRQPANKDSARDGMQNKRNNKQDKKLISHNENFTAETADRLKNINLCKGLIVLCRVSGTTEYELIVSLPGGMIGHVKAIDLSKSYTNILENIIQTENDLGNEFRTLPELYKPGDNVVCYIENIETDKKWRIDLSLDPELINQNMNNNYLKKGSRLVCTVSSIEETGYVLDTGISNVRAFMSFKDILNDEKYFPGHQLQCGVKSIKTNDNNSIIKLSTKSKHLGMISKNDDVVMDALVPGTIFHLNITKILCNGLEVSFGKQNVGFVNQVYLDDTLSSYSPGMKITGTLLYVLPLVKLAYFSLIIQNPEEKKLQEGDVVENARVVCRDGNGIIVQLGDGLRGIVPLRNTDVNFDEISTKFKPKSTHHCRVISYSWIDKVYSCTMRKEDLEEKYFNLSSFNLGQILNARIYKIDQQFKCILVKTGKIVGTVISEHISDIGSNAINKFKIGQIVKARVLRIDREKHKVFFTLKQSLVESDLPILHDIEKAKCGCIHHGIIVKINPNGVLVRFYGDVKGWASTKSLNENINKNYSIGQIVKVKIKTINVAENKIMLSIINEEINNVKKLKVKSDFSVGESVKGVVVESSSDGMHVKIHIDEENDVTAFLPTGHMAPCKDLANLLVSKCLPGDDVNALVFSTVPNLILTRTFVSQPEYRNINSLNVGDCIPCSIYEIMDAGVKVILPITNFSTFVFIPMQKITNFNSIYKHQILFTKIISIDAIARKLKLTLESDEIWMGGENEMTIAVDVLSLYFHKTLELANNSYYQNRPISSAHLGGKVKGVIEKITNDGLVLKLSNNCQGIVRKNHYSGNYKKGDQVSGVIVWINYVHELVDVILLPRIVNGISSKENLTTDVPMQAEIIMITNWFVLVTLGSKGKKNLAALPVRRHLNDFNPNLIPYEIGSKIRCFIVPNDDKPVIMPICVMESVFEEQETSFPDNSKGDNNLKRKNHVRNEHLEPASKKMKEKNHSQSDAWNVTSESKADNSSKKKQSKSKKVKNVTSDMDIERISNASSDSDDTNINIQTNDVSSVKNLTVPACGFSWTNEPNINLNEKNQSSSDSEDESEGQPKQKKKKLSAAERRDLERQKEREIREREEVLASNQMPNSVDQFDRLVLSSPNSSLVWLQYMAYHLQATEIDKARAVAKRAIKTISFREENEKLNVWNAWLNLESKFGSIESLHEVLKEAVRVNEPEKIYTHMLGVHAEAGRQNELEKIISILTGKFKESLDVWINCGKILLSIGLKEKSRHIMQRALQSLPQSQHVNLIVRFAQLENKLGDKERSQTLFEQILSSYPKRVDVWSSYVDALVKAGDIDIARKVLERAVALQLPAKKMKIFFKKFISFEQQHGSPEGVECVQQMVANYVEKQSNIHESY